MQNDVKVVEMQTYFCYFFSWSFCGSHEMFPATWLMMQMISAGSQMTDENSHRNSDANEPNYSPDEIEHMLESVREYLTIAGFEWDLVA